MTETDFQVPFSATGITNTDNGWMQFPEEQRGGSTLTSRIRIPACISYVQITTRSNRQITLNHLVGSSTIQLGVLNSQEGGRYRTSTSVQIEATDDTTELNLVVTPRQQVGEPVDSATIMVIPVAAPRRSGA